jgi:hypothetical protein
MHESVAAHDLNIRHPINLWQDIPYTGRRPSLNCGGVLEGKKHCSEVQLIQQRTTQVMLKDDRQPPDGLANILKNTAQNILVSLQDLNPERATSDSH